MAILTDYMEKKLLDHAFGQAEFSTPSTLYLGVSTTAFVDSDNGTTAAAKEPSSSNAYARQRLDNVVDLYTSDFDIRNNASIDFPTVTNSNWGNVQYWGIFDGSGTSANMLMHGSFSSGTTVNVGDQFRISSGDFEITFPSSIGGDGHWRQQIAWFLGFDYTSSPTDNLRFYYYTKANSGYSGFYDEALYLALSTSAFTDDIYGSSIELSTSGTGYARVKILDADDGSVDYFSAAATASGTTILTNDVAVVFPEATSSWGTVSHFAIFRGATSGSYDASALGTGNQARHPLFRGALSSSVSISSGDRLRFAANGLTIEAS